MFTINSTIESELKTTPQQRWENNKQAIITLQNLGTTPTQEQLQTLAKFNGWGCLPEIFSLNPQTRWVAKAQKELLTLLEQNEFNNAASSILNAHYTEPKIIRSIWEMLSRIGFTGGRILEPACGTGLFFGLMPEDIRCNSKLFGIELDKTPATIAKYLYPEAKIYNQGFEEVSFPEGYFDLVCGNFPFGDYGVNDSKYNFLGVSIHNYFLAKSADLVREEGLIAVITSTYTLDAPSSQKFRAWLRQKLELVTAVRLPSGVFNTITRTQVSPILLIFQKVKNPRHSNTSKWINTQEVQIVPQDWGNEGDKTKAHLNEYFLSEFQGRSFDKYYQDQLRKSPQYTHLQQRIYPHVHHLLGTPSINKLYGEGFALLDDGRDLSEALCKIPLNVNYFPRKQGEELLLVPPELQHIKEMAFCIHENQIYQRAKSHLVLVETVERNRIEDFWKLRSCLIKVINAQQTVNDEELTQLQQELKNSYNSFIRKWGRINSKYNLIHLGKDPNYYLVRTLEKSNYKLADIFSKRVCRSYSAPTKVNSAQDALTHSLNIKGCLDLDYISEISHLTPEEIIQQLDADNLIFYNPTTQKWELAAQYLSGNVYRKLQEAIAVNLPKNIEALKAVQPLPMLPDATEDIKLACLETSNIDWNSLTDSQKDKILNKKIHIMLGTNWIKPEIYQQFAKEILKIKVTISHITSSSTSFWTVGENSDDITEYGTSYIDSAKLLEKGLNRQDPRIIIYASKDTINTVASNEATEEARAKLELIKSAFRNWIWENQQRCVELYTYYNTQINVFSARKYNGNYLQLPGSNPHVQLNYWQLDGVSRILEENATFLAHDVGLGKTYTMISAIMECRRLGLAKKPMLVVLNGTEKQIEESFRYLYPMANLLVPEKLDAEGRKIFTAAIQTGDFDCTIITHSQFFSLALSEDYQLAFHNQEKEILQAFLRNESNNRITTKQLKKALKNLESKINKVTASTRKDNHIDFDNLTDMLVIDEIHEFKNLSIITKMYNIRGIPNNWSQRASDTYMKILHTLGDMLTETCSQFTGKVIGATGTILSNTMAELFNWMRMFQLPKLRELGIETFDEWASQFAEPTSSAEVTASGKYKVVTRFKSFCNIQALRGLMDQFVDLRTNDNIGDVLKRPKPKFIDVVVEPSPAQLQFLREALKRAEKIYTRQVAPSIDNMLKVTTDLTKAALTMRLLGEPKEADTSKLHECVWNSWQIWKLTNNVKGTQLIFCDASIPKPDKYSTYLYLKMLFIALGIPESQIAFVHDFNKSKRTKLFELIDSGQVRILLGSTKKLGTGCNVHLRGLWAIHHLDAPWRPSDLTQREGRGIRQGNGELIGSTLPFVWIFRYVTERLDALRWQTLQWKQEMTTKFLNGEDLDNVEDCDQGVYSYAQIKSMATGNSLLIEESNLRSELNSLLIQQRSHQRQQFSLGWNIDNWNRKIQDLKRKIELLQEDLQIINPGLKDIEAAQISRRISLECKEIFQNQNTSTRKVANYRGFDVYAYYRPGNNKLGIYIKCCGNEYYFPWVMNNKRESIDFQRSHPLISLDALIDSLPEYLPKLQEELENAQVENARLESLVGQSFPHTERIADISQRLQEIDAILQEDEAALDVSEVSSHEENTEDSDDDFWLDDERCIQECHIHPGIVDKLFSRSIENIEWISDIYHVVKTFKSIDYQASASSTINKIHDFPSSINKVGGIQLSLF
jgi:N12 class adenine-specific DNA methylase